MDYTGNGKMDIQRRCFLFNISVYQIFNVFLHLLTEGEGRKSGGRAEEERSFVGDGIKKRGGGSHSSLELV